MRPDETDGAKWGIGTTKGPKRQDMQGLTEIDHPATAVLLRANSTSKIVLAFEVATGAVGLPAVGAWNARAESG